jgi:hypothetical protein
MDADQQSLSVGDTVEFRATVVEILEDGFVRATGKPTTQELADAREVVDLIKAIHASWGHKLRLLVDMRQVRSLSRDARLLYQSEEYGAALVGCTLMVDSGISRVIGNFAIGLNKGHVNVRLFTTEADARAWLTSLPDE